MRSNTPVRNKRPSSIAVTDQPSKRIRKELTHHDGGNCTSFDIISYYDLFLIFKNCIAY